MDKLVNERTLAVRAQRIVREVPGVEFEVERRAGDRRPEAVLHFAGKDARVALEFKSRANAATAWQIVHQAQRHRGAPVLLVANDATTEARIILRDHGIGVIDGSGYAHLELPGLLLHVEGGRRAQSLRAAPARLRGRAGVLAQALLLDQGRTWKVQDLATAAEVSPALAHRVLVRLDDLGIVATDGEGPLRTRHVVNAAALIDLLGEEVVTTMTRTTAYLLAQTPRQLVDQLAKNLERAGVPYALTGAAGANLVAPFVTAVPVTDVWVTVGVDATELHEAAGTEDVDAGHNVVFLQERDDSPLAFREQVDGVWVANRFRMYADLLADPRRGREQAEHLRREMIGL